MPFMPCQLRLFEEKEGFSFAGRGETFPIQPVHLSMVSIERKSKDALYLAKH
jgi:hypothetical protein